MGGSEAKKNVPAVEVVAVMAGAGACTAGGGVSALVVAPATVIVPVASIGGLLPVSCASWMAPGALASRAPITMPVNGTPVLASSSVPLSDNTAGGLTGMTPLPLWRRKIPPKARAATTRYGNTWGPDGRLARP